MQKMRTRYVIALILALVTVAGVAAHGYTGNSQDGQQVIEQGTYQDLVDLREQLGVNVMPMVDDEEDFAWMQQRHEAMEQYAGYGMHGYGMRGGCWH